MKAKYRIRNWNKYNKSLIQRGSLTVWFSEEACKKWLAPREVRKRGRPELFSDDAILTALMVRFVFHGKVRQHGISKRRTWKKIHLAVCPDSHEIVLEMLTDNKVADCEVYPEFLNALPQSVKRTFGDGAYDAKACYAANMKHGSTPIIPPDRNAVFQKEAPAYMETRNNNLLEIMGLGGDDGARKLWKKLKEYHRRSLAETAMFRLKRMFGGNLQSRTIENQRAEARAKCQALNIMTRLGMPKSELVAA